MAEEYIERSNNAVVLRDVEAPDLARIHDIHTHYVLSGSTPALHAADRTELTRRAEAILAAGLPYLVATVNNVVVGYACADVCRTLSADAQALEDSVYIIPGSRGHGLGSALLSAVLARCQGGPWKQMIAVIGEGANTAAIRLHERHGFVLVEVHSEAAKQHDRPARAVVMQRKLRAGLTRVRAFPDIP